MITYRATLDVHHDLARYLGRLLRAERHRRGTRIRTRALTLCVPKNPSTRVKRHVDTHGGLRRGGLAGVR